MKNWVIFYVARTPSAEAYENVGLKLFFKTFLGFFLTFLKVEVIF